jgi:uncharacterized protein
MNEYLIIRQVEEFAKQYSADYDTGHDWWHLHRVRNIALYLRSVEDAGNAFIVEISALLHDLDDKKFSQSELMSTEEKVGSYLKSLGVDEGIISEVLFINKNISFSNEIKPERSSIEFRIVQDADRLDAIGAIGIARAFNYGGFRNNSIYDPENDSPSTIRHFYDKLLRLAGLMNTDAAKKIAVKRHEFLELYLKQFYGEWEFGKRS